MGVAPGHIPNLACFPFLNFFSICIILVPEYAHDDHDDDDGYTYTLTYACNGHGG